MSYNWKSIVIELIIVITTATNPVIIGSQTTPVTKQLTRAVESRRSSNNANIEMLLTTVMKEVMMTYDINNTSK